MTTTQNESKLLLSPAADNDATPSGNATSSTDNVHGFLQDSIDLTNEMFQVQVDDDSLMMDGRFHRCAGFQVARCFNCERGIP
mmetsp:Transcript_2062/g.7422  ORF Transcript_2062/g.7422 Transcript_2062/m.7422 type:complete len:83 (-) Transcript_2062:2416-2664(-)